MNSFYTYFLCCLLFTTILFSQEERVFETKTFELRGSVIQAKDNTPILNVKIDVNEGQYTTTNNLGQFKVRVKIGDELIIRHDSFETIYYTVQSNERLQIRVEEELANKKTYKANNEPDSFNSLIDSVDTYLKSDVEKSVNFITQALEKTNSNENNAIAYETLGDVYFHWKQYDLAISNYEISLLNNETYSAKLKLVEAYKYNQQYDEGLAELETISKKKLSNWEEVRYYEEFGDIYLEKQEFDKAIEYYDLGLKAAEKHQIKSKITDLNSKIAKVYSDKGELDEAKKFFKNSLNLASKENIEREIKERVTVADFENKNQDYNVEIELRKQALQSINKIVNDSTLFNNLSPLTPQKQNYKIGNAFALQDDFDKAIPYLEKSIEEAKNRNDLVVEKDAYRALAEAQRSNGDVESAIASIDKYEMLVDELYIKKEQEISQAANFGRRIAESQSRILSLENDRKLSLSNYALTQERDKRQKLIIYSLIGGLILSLISAYALVKYIKQQRLTNNLLALKSLRSQMNPHFIFNALNSVNSFIATNDERSANKYLSDFSLLMRAVLENSEESFIPLEKEIELLKLYTQLEHSRFKDKFDYSIIIDENVNIQEFQIPPMLLQPYIENAVWHGLRYKKEKGKLNISITQSNTSELIIIITDDGIGRMRSKALKTGNQQKQKSKGMGNIKKRVEILNKMYKDKIDVSLSDFQNEEDAGTKVIVTIKRD